jgi:manganese transport protein
MAEDQEPGKRVRRQYAGEEVGGNFDQSTVSSAETILEGSQSGNRFKRLLPFLGPAFIASIAYIDPGNFATNILAGADYGYLLLWVVVASNLMAMLIQSLSAKLGIATGKNLAELIGKNFPKPVVWIFWAIAEVIAMATDLAEFLGAAVGINLVFGIPLFMSGIITGIATFGILALQQFGFRMLEAIITVFVGVIAFCYVIETFIAEPDWAAAADSFTPPRFDGTESILLATGILGATVMPHVIYLHSALTQDRIVARNDRQKLRLFRFEVVDVIIAMGLAGFVNAAMLMMAAVTYFGTGLLKPDDDLILQAYQTLTPILGNSASLIFGISLIAAGLSSSTVGTMAGQVIMQGFLGWKLPLWLRRGVTMAPALIVIGLGVETTRTLVISQVILSFGIPFALIPLVMFTSRKDLMGILINRRSTTVIAWIIAMIIVALNGFLLYETLL